MHLAYFLQKETKLKRSLKIDQTYTKKGKSLGKIFSNPRKDYQMAYKQTTSAMEEKFSFHVLEEVVDVWTWI